MKEVEFLLANNSCSLRVGRAAGGCCSVLHHCRSFLMRLFSSSLSRSIWSKTELLIDAWSSDKSGYRRIIYPSGFNTSLGVALGACVDCMCMHVRVCVRGFCCLTKSEDVITNLLILLSAADTCGDTEHQLTPAGTLTTQTKVSWLLANHAVSWSLLC